MKISRNKLKEIVRESLMEDSEYQQFFAKALEKSGKQIPDMSDDEKKAFFDKIDAAWNGKGEKKELGEAEDSNSSDFQDFFKRALAKAGKSIPSMTPDEKEKFFNQIDASWNGKGEKKEVGEAMDDECEECSKNMNEGIFDMFKKKSIDDEELGKKILQKLQNIKVSDVQKTFISGSLFTYLDNVVVRWNRKNNAIEIGNDDDILNISNNLRNSIRDILKKKYKEFEIKKKAEHDAILKSKDDLRDTRVSDIKKKLGEYTYTSDKTIPAPTTSKNGIPIDPKLVNFLEKNSKYGKSSIYQFFDKLKNKSELVALANVIKKGGKHGNLGYTLNVLIEYVLNGKGEVHRFLADKRFFSESIKEWDDNSIKKYGAAMKKGLGGNDTLMIQLGGSGHYWPWYLQKIDSTHFKMANNEKALSTGAAMVHHVGQHRGEVYYDDLVKWLHGSIPTAKLNGKKYKGNG